MTVRGKQIADAFYQKSHTKAYFAGCSTGGQNALMEAQRFPNDYDGILAGAAAFNRTHIHMVPLAVWQDTHASASRFILPGQMTLINNAVIAQCVGRDGGASTDQFLTDPRDCHFDPKALLCTGGKVPPACLTADQVTTMQKYYAGTIDPVNGQVIYPGYERGNETDNVLGLGLVLMESSRTGVRRPVLLGVRPSFGHPASAVNFANFDFHRAVDTVDDQLADVLNADSTNLGEFREHGGKLLMYHGWADPLIPSQSSIMDFNAPVVANIPACNRRASSGAIPKLDKTQKDARLLTCSGCTTAPAGPAPTCSMRSHRSSPGLRLAWRRRRSLPPSSSTIRRPRCR